MCIACDAAENICQEFGWEPELVEMVVGFAVNLHGEALEGVCEEHAVERLMDTAGLACAFAHFATVHGGLPDDLDVVPGRPELVQ